MHIEVVNGKSLYEISGEGRDTVGLLLLISISFETLSCMGLVTERRIAKSSKPGPAVQ